MDDSKEDVVMSKSTFKIKCFLVLFLIVLMSACAPAKKNTYYEKRKKSSQVNASQLGRNKYYFSSGYQKKLSKNYRKK
jgi:hypothetical protein